ncbi:MAG: DUF4382 domain-containing protein [Thermoplasmatales archaeon]
MNRNSVIAIVAVAAVIIAGVAVYEYYGTVGTLSISVADAPAGNISAVYITFSSISLHSNSSGWINLSVGNKIVNIYGLTVNNSSFLGSFSLHSGKYTTLRVYVTNVSVVIGGVNETFHLASKFAFLNHPFYIAPHSATKFTLEFSLNQCLNERSMIFTPYIGIVES